MRSVTTDPLVSRQEVADFLGIPAATLTQWAHNRKGPKYVRIGRHARYAWADVRQWLAEQEQGPREDDGGRAA
jgi:excisionase family DNA binding protein